MYMKTVAKNDVVGTIFNSLWSSVSPPVASSAARNTHAQAFRARVQNALAPQVPYSTLAMKLIAAFQLGGLFDRNIVG